MAGFIFETVSTIISEPGALSELGELINARFEAQHILLVSDQGLVELGLVDEAVDALMNAGLSVTIFDQVTADPMAQTILDATLTAEGVEADLIIGFGGGSSMDVAKMVSVLAFGEQPLEEMYGIGNIISDRLPLIQIPTTAGTGSEVTPIAVVTRDEHTKMGIVSPVLFADIALLDAKLTLGLPRAITAATGIDAMVHAIEAYTSKRLKNPVSDMLACEALRLLTQNMPKVIDNGRDLAAREKMLLGACYAGQAFSNAPVAGVHALAYPIGGFFHASHGLSNSLVLPHVLRYNLPDAAPLYAELHDVILPASDDSITAKATAFIAHMEHLIALTGIETNISQLGAAEADLDRMTDEALIHERLLINNPREMDRDGIYSIYKAAL